MTKQMTIVVTGALRVINIPNMKITDGRKSSFANSEDTSHQELHNVCHSICNFLKNDTVL